MIEAKKQEEKPDVNPGGSDKGKKGKVLFCSLCTKWENIYVDDNPHNRNRMELHRKANHTIFNPDGTTRTVRSLSEKDEKTRA